jgi:hypothetical protein
LQENVSWKSKIETRVTLLAQLPNRSIYISVNATRTTETDPLYMLISTITELIYYTLLLAFNGERIASY